MPIACQTNKRNFWPFLSKKLNSTAGPLGGSQEGIWTSNGCVLILFFMYVSMPRGMVAFRCSDVEIQFVLKIAQNSLKQRKQPKIDFYAKHLHTLRGHHKAMTPDMAKVNQNAFKMFGFGGESSEGYIPYILCEDIDPGTNILDIHPGPLISHTLTFPCKKWPQGQNGPKMVQKWPF